MDQGLNSLLKWGIANSDSASNGPRSGDATRAGLNEDALRQLMGGPSDADLMRQAMSVITNNEADHDAKMTAFDNFEQLIENLDNANNMEALGLWSPLLAELQNSNPDMRRMSAWCIGTAVQNNVKAQERLLAMGAIPQLCRMTTEDSDKAAKKKAVFALSSAIRNYQPSTNEALKSLPGDIVGTHKVDAGDMDAIDVIMNQLRNNV